MGENDFDVGCTPRGYTSGSTQVSIHLETPRRPAMGKRVLNEMIGDSWNTHCVRRRSYRYNAELKRQIRYGGQKSCMACCRHAALCSQESRTR